MTRMEMKMVLFSKIPAKRSSPWCPLFEETTSSMLSFILIYKFSLDYVVAVAVVVVVAAAAAAAAAAVAAAAVAAAAAATMDVDKIYT